MSEPENDKQPIVQNDDADENGKMTRYGAIKTDDYDVPLTSEKSSDNPPSYTESEPIRDSGKHEHKKSGSRRNKEEQQVYEANIREFADALLSNTSLIAIANIVKRRHAILRTLWAIALISCLILSIRQLYSLSARYFSHPVTTSVELSYQSFNFPTITICNHNPLRRSQVAAFGSETLNSFFNDLNNRNYSSADNGTQLETQQKDWQTFHKLISNISIEKRILMGYQLKDFILQCNFGGKKCSLERFSLLVTKTYGNCYSFNGFNSKEKSSLVAKIGREHGLIMTVYLEYDEYLKNFIPSSGVKVDIHEHGSIAFPETLGFSVPPGYQTSIGISLKRTSRLQKPYGDCNDGKQFYKDYKMKYTYGSCLAACKHSYIMKTCKCYSGAEPVFYRGHTKILKPCLTEKQVECMLKFTYLGEQGDLNCGCRLPCEETYYKFVPSLSEWPADSYEERLFGDLRDIKPEISKLSNVTKELARRNLLNIIVYVEDQTIEEIRERPSYNWDSYLSDIGGSLGLFLGFSVLTGFELIEAVALFFAYISGKIIYRSDDDDVASHIGLRSRRNSQFSLNGSIQNLHHGGGDLHVPPSSPTVK